MLFSEKWDNYRHFHFLFNVQPSLEGKVVGKGYIPFKTSHNFPFGLFQIVMDLLKTGSLGWWQALSRMVHEQRKFKEILK